MSQIIIEHFHGAASRVPVSATACAMRVTGFNVVIVSQWMDPRENEPSHRVVARDVRGAQAVSGRDALRQLPRPDDAGDPAAVAYGPNSAGCGRSRRRYDPENFFHANVEHPPA